MRRHLTPFLISLVLFASPVQAAATEKPVSIVLVHGAFVDGSGWKPVHDALSDRGYEVLIVQNPTVTLEGDAEATRQVIARAKHPVVLVGHSYGGAVISQAGDDPKVQSLVYIAAFAPDVGESVFDLASKPHPGEEAAPLLPPADGFLLVDRAKFPTSFAADVDASTTRFMNASQVPWGLGAVQFKLTKAAWKTKPVHYMLTLEDHMVPPSGQRLMATRAKARIVEIKSSHAAMLSHPQDVADFIESAVPQK
jgi:pimeloyl-ACP methyl ester carboxylesterase